MLEASKVADAAAFIAEKGKGFVPSIAIVTGTGLDGLGSMMKRAVSLDYKDIPGFPESHVASHPGKLLLGSLAGKNVAMLHGRLHLYEGWTAKEVARPVRALAKLGSKILIATNCAGALEPSYVAPCMMLIVDHFNMTGTSPISGKHEPELGPQFADMSHCYDLKLRQLARETAEEVHLTLHEGAYFGMHGPQLETNIERRVFRQLGGHAVGQSTVIEVIAARQAQMRVLGFSALANMATGEFDQRSDNLEEIIEATRMIAADLQKLILELLPKLN